YLGRHTPRSRAPRAGRLDPERHRLPVFPPSSPERLGQLREGRPAHPGEARARAGAERARVAGARHVRRPRHRAAMSPGLQRAIVAATMMMATILVILDVTIANVALDHMRGTLSAAVDEITWVLTAFLVANAISVPITGWLTDLLGRKRLFIVATVAFTLTSAAAGAAPAWPSS